MPIRRSALLDHEWLSDTAAEVYRPFGDYRAVVIAWLRHPAVLSYVEESEAPPPSRRGFIVLSFSEEESPRPGACLADLLAIGVAPGHRRRGVGRALLDYAVHVARMARAQHDVPELRLSVADSNLPARRLFASAGFHEVDAERGRYDGGQRAIRMALPL